jgi:NitT/TauT family transport system permease protein
LLLCAAVYPALLCFAGRRASLKKRLYEKSLFYTALFILLTVLNIITAKAALLPPLHFPSFDRILGVFIQDRAILLRCLAYSGRLLLLGYLCGAALGFLTGMAIGFSKIAEYWLSPPLHALGPMPSTAWLPILLVVFPSALSASIVLITITVWFPVTLMTASGVANIEQQYFDAGKLLGARGFQKILYIGIPAAAPHIFLGLFIGACMSFTTLVVAELIGAKYGIGWYINWQKDMLSYANVYAGLIIIAVVFSLLVSGLFKARDRVLAWQKGVVKW